MFDERKCHCEALWAVAISVLFLVGCTFIDDYDIELMQDATASVGTSSSEGNPSTSSETLSSSSREESSSSSSREETSSSSHKDETSSSSDKQSSSSSEIASCSSKDESSSSSNAETLSSSSDANLVESSSSSTPVESSSSAPAAFKCGSDFSDSRDEAKYATVKIGTQCWFAENLNYSAKNSACYGDDDANCTKYGRLYRWTEAQSACPEGSRLPTADDWDELLNYLGNPMVAGKYLKDESSWSVAEDAYGFSALPAGYYSEDDEYVQIEQMTVFWSAAASGPDAESYVLRSSEISIERGIYPKTNKMSVRCLVE
ncbi:MAG: hypothetical protein II801_03355 [Bacteroidaceae bacterium]|nr:hypothetical protein [Bacteroidaceae bacterium]